MSNTPLYFLIAGEASGDLLGARLMRALKAKANGQIRFAGVGGERMQAEGMDLLFEQQVLAHFGLFELIRHIPNILRRIQQTVAEVKRCQPAALITIDAPDFCFRVIKQLKKAGVKTPCIHYVAPTVWAWRAKRAKKIARFLDHLLALLPFEPPYFTRENLPCTFVGHSIVESAVDQGNAARFRSAHGLFEPAPILTLLPGSRMSEVKRLLPIFAETVELLRAEFPDLVLTLPVAAGVAAYVQQQVAAWNFPVIITAGDAEKYDGFAAATAALACSGTVSVELALAHLPAVIAYKINWLTYYLYRGLIKVKYATLVNLMQDRMVMPELLQENCTAQKLAAEIGGLLRDPAARAAQAAALGAVAGWLGQGEFVPSERAADVVLNVVRQAASVDPTSNQRAI